MEEREPSDSQRDQTREYITGQVQSLRNSRWLLKTLDLFVRHLGSQMERPSGVRQGHEWKSLSNGIV